MLNNDFNDNPDSSKMITDELPISNNIITEHFLYHTNTQLNLKWESKIISAHSGGIGGITIPEIYKNKLHLEEYYEITFPLNTQELFSKLLKLSKVKNKYIFYLPKELEYLVGRTILIQLIYNNFIPIKLSVNYQITLPVSLIDKFQLRDHDIYEIEIVFKNHYFNKIVLINRKDRSKEREKRQIDINKFKDSYYITFPYENIQQGTEGQLKLIRKLESPIYQEINEERIFYIPNIYYNNDNNRYLIGNINENQIIVLAERSLSVQLPLQICINDSMIYYFGCYLADGSTHGDSTSINASTFLQSKFFIEIYNSFIYDSNLVFYLAYTKSAIDKRTDEEIKDYLNQYWQKISPITIDNSKIRIWTSKFESRERTKMTDYGTLEINDARKIVKILYINLMEKITTLLLESKPKKLIWKFLLGFLEGDGTTYVSSAGRFFIKFAANIDNVDLLTKLLDIVEVNFSLDNTRIKAGGKGIHIIVSIQQILKHLNEIAPEIFKYYPKRRKLFVTRFFMSFSVQYLTGYRKNLNQPSVEKYLNENIKANTIIMNEIKILEQELHSYGSEIADYVNEFNKYGKYLLKENKKDFN